MKINSELRTISDLDIDGKFFDLKINFLAISQIEQYACIGASGLMTRIRTKTFGIVDMTAIIYGGICGNAGNDRKLRYSFDQIGEMIIKHGSHHFIDVCTTIIEWCFYGDVDLKENYTPKKKVKSS